MPGGNAFPSILRLLIETADRTTRRYMVTSALLVVTGGALAAATPLALKRLVDAVMIAAADKHMPFAALLAPGALYVASLCLARLLSDVRPMLVNATDQRLVAALRSRYFHHVLRMPLDSVYGRRSGEVLHCVDLGCAGVQLLVTHLVNSLVPVVVELTVMTLILIQLAQPVIVFLFGATAALYFVVFAFGAFRLGRHAKTVTADSLAVHGQLAGGLGNAETLRCFTAELQAEQELAAASNSLMRSWRRYYQASTSTAVAATLVFATSLSACLAVAADAVARGTLTVGGFVLTSVYLLQMVRPLEVLGSAARDLSRSLGFVQPLLELLRETPEPETHTAEKPSPAPPSRPAPVAPAIRIEALRFGYDPDKPVIEGLDLALEPGQTMAIVGPSGSGKSSLIRLMLRLYSPQSGRILLDGCAIETLPLADLRRRIALVPQDSPLLHTTIAGNIALGMPDANRDRIEQAAMAARLHHVITALPQGYDTIVGERGLKLSGGERQRLAIARALLRRPGVFLLDEPTSMLDGRTEAEVMNELRVATEGCTTLIVAHRLSTVMHADEIVFMKEGRILERGSHIDLLKRAGAYSQLWQHQLHGVATSAHAG